MLLERNRAALAALQSIAYNRALPLDEVNNPIFTGCDLERIELPGLVASGFVTLDRSDKSYPVYRSTETGRAALDHMRAQSEHASPYVAYRPFSCDVHSPTSRNTRTTFALVA